MKTKKCGPSGKALLGKMLIFLGTAVTGLFILAGGSFEVLNGPDFGNWKKGEQITNIAAMAMIFVGILPTLFSMSIVVEKFTNTYAEPETDISSKAKKWGLIYLFNLMTLNLIAWRFNLASEAEMTYGAGLLAFSFLLTIPLMRKETTNEPVLS